MTAGNDDTPRPTVHLAATSRSVDVAWNSFDAATIRFHALYATAGAPGETSADIAARRRAGEEALRLWDAWRALFLADDGGPGAAA